MKPLRPFLLLLIAALVIGGCGRLGNPDLDVRTFNLDHKSGFEVADLIQPYVFSDRADNPGSMSATHQAITVRETRDNLEKIARVLAEFDQPTPGIRLRFRLIEADSFQEEDPEIADVVRELRSLFRFDGYRLMGEAMVAIGSGEVSFEQPFFGVSEDLGVGPYEGYVVRGDAVIWNRGAVQLHGLTLWAEGEPTLETSVTASLGHTLVIGGSRAGRSGRTLILTVRAETAE